MAANIIIGAQVVRQITEITNEKQKLHQVHNLTYLVFNVVLGLYNFKSAPLDVTTFQNLYDNIANQL